MTAHDQLTALVADTRLAVPGGVLNAADLQGLNARAKALGVGRDEASAIILARPRHPATNIGE